MDLNLYALNTFRIVVDKSSFSKAAKTLFLTQPAVSLQIQSLENYFQVPLLIRGSSGKITPTREGKVLYDYTLKLLDFQEDLFQEMRTYSQDFSLRLRLGACFIAGEHFIPPILNSYNLKYPKTRLSMNIIRCEKIYEGLMSGIFDIGITGIPTTQKTLVQKEITRVPLDLYESGKNKSRSRSISIRQLLDKPLIMREEGAGMYYEFDKLLKAHNIKINSFRHICVSESNEAIKSLVMADMGFSVFPPFMVRNEVKNKDLAKINLKEGKLDQGFYINYRKKSKIHEHQQEMIDFMIREIRKVKFPSA
jgi:DNA-binding transcriptional LysR family regulator